ncbi:spermatogenesis associated 6-like protein [Acomys russatus]|uniref:spermatogenesis associated 6-like protein n=1 Tax=Acomys russatus TaxID=60746 RepID=UPI0021E2C63E|nr:spermatogenesis associated 6-like protein [Acomys russatus]
MPLEVVVELQIREISCPGVFLRDKEGVYLGVYLLNQYLETGCFSSVFPIVIQQSMIFQKVFENAIDPGAVAELLESFLTRFELIQLVSPVWEELAYYEENTRDFLFPEPKLTSSHLGLQRELLMKTARGFPGIAPKLEFSTRTAIRECVFLQRNRFIEEKYKLQRPLSKSHGQRVLANNRKMNPKAKSPDGHPKGTQCRLHVPSFSGHLLRHQPTQLNLGESFRFHGETRPPFVVRHVDSGNPFGENTLVHHSQKSRRKSKFLNFAFPVRKASSLDSLAANVKVIREPDERIVLRSQSPSTLDSTKFGKPLPSHQGDANVHQETLVATSQLSRSLSPLDQPLLRKRFQPRSQSTWKKIHERVCSLLTTHRAHSKEDFISETNCICERPSYPLKIQTLYAEKYF